MLSGAHKMGIWLLSGLMAVLAMFFNLFILLVSLRNYRKNQHWRPCETIITAISLASAVHQLLSYFWMTMYEMDTQCLYGLLYSIMLVLVFSLKFTIMWTTAFLTFYYGTKLVIEPIHCYTRIQEVIVKHVTTAVVVILLCGFANSLPLLAVLRHHSNVTWENDCSALMTDRLPEHIYMIYYLLISDVVPGVLVVKSSVSISVHLAIHLRHMKANANGFHAPKLGSEMRVIRMTLALVTVFLCFLVVDLYVHLNAVLGRGNSIMLALLFSSIYTTLSMLVLIYGKKSFWKELLHSYNLCLEVYPCLTCLKVPETKRDASNTPKH